MKKFLLFLLPILAFSQAKVTVVSVLPTTCIVPSLYSLQTAAGIGTLYVCSATNVLSVVPGYSLPPPPPVASVSVPGVVKLGSTAGTAAQGNDSRITNAVQSTDPRLSGNLKSTNNLSDVANPSVALQNLGGIGPNGVIKVNGVTFPAGAPNQGSVPLVSSPNTIGYNLIRNINMFNPFVSVLAGTGLLGGGQIALGASSTLSVKYGSAAGTAAQGNDPRFGIANTVVGAAGVPFSAVGSFGPPQTALVGTYACWYDQNDIVQHCIDSLGTVSSTIKTLVGGVSTSCAQGSVVTGFGKDGTPTCGGGVAPAVTGTLFVCVDPSGKLLSQPAPCSGS